MFEPCAQTAWHTHPPGQTLIVTSGSGLVQSWDGPIREIRPGDVMWCPPGEKHWHGATPSTAVTHIVSVEELLRRLIWGVGAVKEAQAPSRSPADPDFRRGPRVGIAV
jgi:quercetin dioxygenase-like cupin family protein